MKGLKEVIQEYMDNIGKECSRCFEYKNINDFGKDKYSKDLHKPHCKGCNSIMNMKFNHSKIGLVSKIYYHQLYSSKNRGHGKPLYTKDELIEWVILKQDFNELYNTRKESDYKTVLIPSIDRLDDYKGYSLNNIQLMTWEDNRTKGYIDRRQGRNNKSSKAVVKLTLSGVFIKEYYSLCEASRDTGVDQPNITKCCRGRGKTAGGFIWKYY